MHFFINAIKFAFYYFDYIIFYLIIAYIFSKHVVPFLKRSNKDRKLREESILVEINSVKSLLRNEKKELKEKKILLEKINKKMAIWKNKKAREVEVSFYNASEWNKKIKHKASLKNKNYKNMKKYDGVYSGFLSEVISSGCRKADITMIKKAINQKVVIEGQ
jgi:hypothetical protein